MNPTYPEKRIHTKSFPYVETERLVARLEWIRERRSGLHRSHEQKGSLRDLAREVVNLERELEYRSVRFRPVSDGVHLTTLPVTTKNRRLYPPESRRARLRPSRNSLVARATCRYAEVAHGGSCTLAAEPSRKR